MAIRRISDLPIVGYYESALTGTSRTELISSLIETSYVANGDEASQFRSCAMRIGDLSAYVIYDIIGGSFAFGGNKSFLNSVTFKQGLVSNGNITQTAGSLNVSIGGNISLVTTNNILLSTAPSRSIGIYSKINAINALSTLTLTSGSSTTLTSQQIAISSSNSTKIVSDNLSVYGNTDLTIRTTTGNISFKRNNDIIATTNSTNNFVFTNDVIGTAVRAKWADVAEYYEADSIYSPGTLVKFGGEKELTIANDYANAVVTTKPGVVLNNKQNEAAVAIALVGRTPVRTIGKVKKFENLVLSRIPGVACAASCFSNEELQHKPTIAKALVTKDTEEEELVECAVKLEF